MNEHDDYLWNPDAPPDAAIAALVIALKPAAHRAIPMRVTAGATIPLHVHQRMRRIAFAAAAMLVVALSVYATTHSHASAPWSVVATKGTAFTRDASQRTTNTLGVGGTIETGATGAARLAVANIGRVDLAPGSRLRLIRDETTEHRLSLDVGRMHAVIDAPPRVFLVEASGILAADLGCEYTLGVDSSGNGAIVVDVGEVELDGAGVRSAVLAGNSASVHRGRAPGLPLPLSASETLRRAVDAFDADPSSDIAARDVIAAADAHSTITLWHLLQRGTPSQRALVFDRLAVLAPPPASVTREHAIAGDSYTLQRWRTGLQPAWSVEQPYWRRVLSTLRR